MNSKTAKCPVCNWEIKDGGVKVNVGAREVIVCCDDCAKKVKANPAQHVQAAK